MRLTSILFIIHLIGTIHSRNTSDETGSENRLNKRLAYSRWISDNNEDDVGQKFILRIPEESVSNTPLQPKPTTAKKIEDKTSLKVSKLVKGISKDIGLAVTSDPDRENFYTRFVPPTTEVGIPMSESLYVSSKSEFNDREEDALPPLGKDENVFPNLNFEDGKSVGKVGTKKKQNPNLEGISPAILSNDLDIDSDPISLNMMSQQNLPSKNQGPLNDNKRINLSGYKQTTNPVKVTLSPQATKEISRKTINIVSRDSKPSEDGNKGVSEPNLNIEATENNDLIDDLLQKMPYIDSFGDVITKTPVLDDDEDLDRKINEKTAGIKKKNYNHNTDKKGESKIMIDSVENSNIRLINLADSTSQKDSKDSQMDDGHHSEHEDTLTETNTEKKRTEKNTKFTARRTSPWPDMRSSTTPKISPQCRLFTADTFTFNRHHSLIEITNKLKLWSETSPFVKVVDITQGNLTVMENPVLMVKIDDPSTGQVVSAKQTVLVVAGIIAQDHYSVSSAMYLIHQLLESQNEREALLTKNRFWIIPVFNPDGYDYSHTFSRRRYWAKNLRQFWEDELSCQNDGVGCTLKKCFGVNLDRNFEYPWLIESHDADDKTEACGSNYAGDRHLSEAETRAFLHLAQGAQPPISYYVSYKESSVLGVLYPSSYTKKPRTKDSQYRDTAKHAADTASSIAGRFFTHGQISEFLDLYTGGIEDWMVDHVGVEDSYAIMLQRSADTDVPIEQVAHESYAALAMLLTHSSEADKKSIKQRSVYDSDRGLGLLSMASKNCNLIALLIATAVAIELLSYE